MGRRIPPQLGLLWMDGQTDGWMDGWRCDGCGGWVGSLPPPSIQQLCSALPASLPRIIQQIFAGFFANSAIPGSQHPFSW